MVVAGFDWDDGNRDKCVKHGVSITEIESVFANDPRIGPDLAHSVDETRLRAIGMTTSGRPAFIVFTMRNGNAALIRPLSARYMHVKEVRRYDSER